MEWNLKKKKSWAVFPTFADKRSSTVLKPGNAVLYQAKPLKHRNYDQK